MVVQRLSSKSGIPASDLAFAMNLQGGLKASHLFSASATTPLSLSGITGIAYLPYMVVVNAVARWTCYNGAMDSSGSGKFCSITLKKDSAFLRLITYITGSHIAKPIFQGVV